MNKKRKHSSQLEFEQVTNNFTNLHGKLKQSQRISYTKNWKYDCIKDEVICSEEVYQIFGVDPLTVKKDFHGFYKCIINLVYNGDKIKLHNAVQKSLAKKAFQIEYRLPQPDGSEKLVLTQGKPIVNEDQLVIGIEGIVKDLSASQRLKKTLEKHDENLIELQRLAKIGSFETDIAQGKTYWSDEALRILGKSSEDYNLDLGSFLKFIHPDDLELVHNAIKYPPKKQPFGFEFRIIRSDDSIRSLYNLIEIIDDEQGNKITIRGTIQDITEKKELQSKLEYTQKAMENIQRRFQTLIQESHDVYVIILPDGTIKYISPAVEKHLGYTPEERVGHKIFDLFVDQDKPKMVNAIQSSLKDKDHCYMDTGIVRTKAGQVICSEYTLRNLLSDPAIEGIVINWRDITDRIEHQKEIVRLSTHDCLTNLPNLEHFRKQLSLACKEAKEKNTSFALINLDIDGFRYVNDALGYQLGDQLILQVAQKLESFIGNDELICRTSGDRFNILVMGPSTIEEYESVAKEIIGLFSQPFKLDIYELYITISLGISIYPEDAQDPDLLLKHAFSSWNWAKKEGKNKYIFFSSHIEDESYKQFIFRNDLRTGLEKNQFKVYYQPLVDLQTNEIIGAEALIRWDHPTWGMVPPDKFIFLAEETGFIVSLGNWILREVCKTYKEWSQNGLPPIKISINYSKPQFFEKDFVENIKSMMTEFELDPEFLIIEITESLLMSNFEQVKSDIQKLQTLGIQVALDDFGTGYSSFSYLTLFNIDILKIDRSFIQEIPLNSKSTVIVSSLIAMMSELGVDLVAEGIEEPEQLDLLRKFNCQIGQGFIFSKPLPRIDFESLLTEKTKKSNKMR